jgi:hypothetical protein
VEVEVRYAGSRGVLIASGERWLLLDADPSPGQAGEIAALLGRSGRVVDALLGLLGEHHPDGLPALAVVDLSAEPVESATRGSGRVIEDDGGRLLSVGAGSVRISDAGRWSSSERGERSVGTPAPDQQPPPARTLIDGIPAHILAASAPDREPAPTLADPVTTSDPVPTGEPPDPDHDGQTTVRIVAGHLRNPTTSETVLAVTCPAGHLTAAYTPECRVCHRPVPVQEPRRVPRPRLGALALPTGEVVPLDRGVVLGRKPRAVPGGEPYPHLVHLPAESTYLSRLHVQIELDGWLVLARDLGSSGGTRLHVPGRDAERLRAQEAYVLEDGHTLDLADVYPVTFTIAPETD